MTASGACRDCGSQRRWRRVDDPDHISCWACWRCEPPPPGVRRVEAFNLVRGEPRVLLDLPAAALNEQLFTHELAEFGAPIAIDLRPLPCRCRVCAPRVSGRAA